MVCQGYPLGLQVIIVCRTDVSTHRRLFSYCLFSLLPLSIVFGLVHADSHLISNMHTGRHQT